MASAALLRSTRAAGCVKPRAELYTRILRDLAKARRDVDAFTESKIARAVGSVREGWRLIETDGSRALLVPATEGAHGLIPKQCLSLPDATWAIPEDFGAGIRRMRAVTRRQRARTVVISSTRTGATWPGTVPADRVWLSYGDPEAPNDMWGNDCKYAREWFPCKGIGGMPNLPVHVDLAFLYWDDRADLSLAWTGDVLHIEAGVWRYVVMGMRP